VEQFWGKRDSYNRTEVAARKRKWSYGNANMNGVNYTDRKEKKKTWRAVKHVEVAPSMTPQLGSESVESEEALGSGHTEQKVEQEDEDMEI